MTALWIVGLFLIALSLTVLGIAFKHLWRAQRYLAREQGISEPIPLGSGRFVIWAWTGALVVGIALVILSYR